MSASNSRRGGSTESSAAAPDFSGSIVDAAVTVARSVSARVLFAYASPVDDANALRDRVAAPTKLVLVCRDENERRRAREASVESILVPPFDLTRMGQIKMATLIAFSQDVLRGGDVFVFLSGASGGTIDTLVVMQVGKEYELFQSVGQPKLTEHIRRTVFEHVLRLTLELAHEGREGKPVGTMFVIGDHREVQKYCQESRINPFRGYSEKARNILDDSIHETVKEIAKLDGAFVVKGNGVIVSGGTTLRPASTPQPPAPGLGSRHSAAAAITAGTRSIAITLSESTGAVRIWRRGQLITEIERAPRPSVSHERYAVNTQ